MEKRGEKDEKRGNKGIFVQFLQAIKKAEARAIERNVGLINVAAKDSWQAAAWYLERRHAKEFGRKDRLGLEGSSEDTAPVIIFKPFPKGKKKESK